MRDSYIYRLTAAARKDPQIATDAPLGDFIRLTLRTLAKDWENKFTEAANAIARSLIGGAIKHNDTAMQAALAKAEFGVKFKPTKGMNDAARAAIAENVALIKSIQQQFHSRIESDVWRSINSGFDIAALKKMLTTQYQVTNKRATLIAKDQSRKLHGTFEKERRLELGITQAKWIHSHAGKVPRKSHEAMNGKLFDIEKGMWDEDARQWIQPGYLINCRCTSAAVIPGLEDDE